MDDGGVNSGKTCSRINNPFHNDRLSNCEIEGFENGAVLVTDPDHNPKNRPTQVYLSDEVRHDIRPRGT